MPFMVEIDAARPQPLDQLAQDFFMLRTKTPSLEFCRRVAGVEVSDEILARRLSVAISTVRSWRELGRRWSCR